MTVLEAEEDTDEQSAPPRKKFCLSLSGRNRTVTKTTAEPPRATIGGGDLDQKSNSFGTSKMLNGCRNQSSSHPTTNYDIMGPGSDCLRIATLCNLGNTCFLNSVLYTLRFTPSFLHNLHHLAIDLSSLNDKQLQTKMKSSSLGRTGVSLSASGNRSMSSKDLLALAGPTHEYNKPRIQVATEKLHELFIALRESEIKENSEPFQPGAFLQALREVNTIFEGNQQQDAHELLVCLLDNIRETFQLLVRHRDSQFGQTNGTLSDFSVERVIDSQTDGITSSKRRTKSWKKVLQKGSMIGVMQNLNGLQSSSKPSENGYSDFSESNGDVNSQHKHESKKCFISEDFEGVSLLRTTCLECEQVTERKEIFCDICVPIDIDRSNDDDDDKKKDKNDSSEVYRRAVVTSELLCGRDKYWCEHCLRLNEARRAVCFPSLPRLLILQLKRFSTAAGSMEKINNYMPTPLDLECFCEECYSEQSQKSGSARSESRHLYQLYSVIMHQGATMTAGHYVAYSKLPDESTEYFRCDRDIKRPHEPRNTMTSNSKGQSLISKYFSRSKPNINENRENSVKTGCRSAECCGIRQGKPLGPGMWLECDDETVRVIQVQELQDKLAHNPRNSATPYLLFYVKTTT